MPIIRCRYTSDICDSHYGCIYRKAEGYQLVFVTENRARPQVDHEDIFPATSRSIVNRCPFGALDILAFFKSLRKQSSLLPHHTQTKNHPEYQVVFMFVRDERLGHLCINILFNHRFPKYCATRPRRSCRSLRCARHTRFLQVSTEAKQFASSSHPNKKPPRVPGSFYVCAR